MPEKKHAVLSAQQFFDRFGANAPREAALRAEELRAAGDTEGHALWLSIQREVSVLVGGETKLRGD